MCVSQALAVPKPSPHNWHCHLVLALRGRAWCASSRFYVRQEVCQQISHLNLTPSWISTWALSAPLSWKLFRNGGTWKVSPVCTANVQTPGARVLKLRLQPSYVHGYLPFIICGLLCELEVLLTNVCVSHFCEITFGTRCSLRLDIFNLTVVSPPVNSSTSSLVVGASFSGDVLVFGGIVRLPVRFRL